MRWSKYFIPTLKEVPSEAEAVSHRLMIRAGLIRKLASGAYTYLPLGLRVLKKVEAIIREEMDAKGALELFLPSLQPVELWHQSGRYKDLGEDLIKFKDRHNRTMVFGPTHEEVITDLVRSNIKSYRQLPITLYQIQTKFRDEVRPRFGVIRSREFIMKDAYSFDRDNAGLDASYKKMYEAYETIFKRCGLRALAVDADTGVMGGDVSHEFMVLAESGEDLLAYCLACGYAASIDVAAVGRGETSAMLKHGGGFASVTLKEVDTLGVSTIEKVSALLKVKPEEMVKTLVYVADEEPVAILIRGDHEANEAKIKKFLKCAKLEMAGEDVIKKATGGPIGFSGPVGIKIRIIADHSIKGIANFVAGANKKDKHLINVNLDRDFKVKEWADLRMITEKDKCPKCNKPIKLEHAIEMGHVFKLGLKYSKAMKAEFLDEDGKLKPAVMGCYGIGVNRIIAAAIELNNDKKGIIWPKPIAPFQVIVIPLNYDKENVRKVADQVYSDLQKKGIEVLLDDRNESAGIKFNDAELIGIPYQVVIGERALKKGVVEVKNRKTAKIQEIKPKDIKDIIPTLT
ncbi:MAG: proline--tRNA ligase [Candidatus Gorgyraea atricola]|nr:proline--tRNA ligase [Candidatus Gorgyraea atricola]